MGIPVRGIRFSSKRVPGSSSRRWASRC